MIFIFAGAGASKALHSEHYPTTVEFFESLPESVVNDPLFERVKAFLEPGEEPRVLDIEQVLWTLHEWREFAGAVLQRGTFPTWLMVKKRLLGLASAAEKYDPRPTLALLKDLYEQGEELTSKINERVYTLYRRAPQVDELERTWLPLLSKALELTSRVDVFTTNYDLVLEEAIQRGGLAIETGRSQEVTPRLTVGLWDAPRSELADRRTGLLTKLHGSIDWIRGEETEIYVGTPQFTGQHHQRAIIYPGFKGVSSQWPFTHFHEYLRTAADQATAAIFVGFAFRDEHISGIVRERLRPGTPILLVGLGDRPPAVPFRSGQYKYVGRGFTTEAVQEMEKWLETSLA